MTIYQMKSDFDAAVKPTGKHDRQTIREAIASWMLNTVSEPTRASRMTALNNFADFSNFIDPYDAIGQCCERGHQWTIWLVLRFRETALEKGKSPASVNTYIANIQSFFRFLHEINFVAGEGCKPVSWYLKLPRIKNAGRTRDVSAMPKDEARRRLREIKNSTVRGKRNKLLMSLMMDVGLRASEVTNLRFDDWNSKKRELLCKRKGHAAKTPVPIAPEVAELFDDYIKALLKIGKPKYLAIKTFGKLDESWGQEPCNRNWLYILTKRLMGTNPHRLRRHAVQVAVNASMAAGIPLEDVKLFTNHKSLETLKEYWDRNDERYRLIAETVAASNRTMDEEGIENEIDF